MFNIRRFHMAILILAASGVFVPAHAQWAQNGIPICTEPGDQYEISIDSDGAGGAVVIWRDERLNDADIYGQRIDAGGALLWPGQFSNNGLAICNAVGTQWMPDVSGDGAGGAWVIWSDQRLGSSTEVYVQRVSGDGQTLWMDDGRWVNFGAGEPGILFDGADGAFVYWAEAVTYPTSVAVQRLNSDGYMQWADYAVAGQGYNISAVLDGSGGLVLGWQLFYANNYGNYVLGQRMDGSGGLSWPGSAVSPSYFCELETDIAADGAGGGLWAYTFSNTFVVQKIDATGGHVWGSGGLNPFPSLIPGSSGTTAVASDGAGGALVMVLDDAGDIHVNRVDAGGNLIWGTAGIAICVQAANLYEPDMASDGQGGAYVVWQDYRNSGTSGGDIYAQHVDQAGALLWGTNGVAVCTATGSQGNPRITASGSSAIVAWTDPRNGQGHFDIYAQALHIDGAIGDPPIRLGSTSPSPNDMGTPVDTDLLFTFTSAAAPGTDWASSVIVQGSQSGLHAGTPVYNATTRTLTLDPATDFAPGETVQVTLTSGIGTVTGYTLDPQSWSFTTATKVSDGTFAAPAASHSVGADPAALCAADLNGDQVMDLAVANNTDNTVSVLLGTGDGGFLPQLVFTTRNGPNDIIAADLDRDGDMDLVTIHASVDEMTILMNTGAANFVSTAVLSVGQNPLQVCTADFDGDGYLDLAVATNSSGPGSAFVLYNDGDGTFGAASPRNAGYFLTSIVARDFDRDGHPDIVCGSGSATDRISVLLGRGDGSFEPKIDTYVDSSVLLVHSADFDRDGDLDIAVTVRAGMLGGTHLYVLDNGGNADFGPPSLYTGAGGNTSELNGDGFPDIVYPSSDRIAVRLNDGSGAFGDEAAYPAGFWPVDLCVADFDGDGAIDIASVDRNGNSVAIHLNQDGISGITTDRVPAATRLLRNVPNPFNPSTKIIYSLREACHVRLGVFDVRGAEVTTLVDERQPAQEHVVAWDGLNSNGQKVATGVYFCRLQAGDYRETMKLTLLK